MNYLNLYNNLISSRKQLIRKKGYGVYYEKHHIFPKWLGGSNAADNLVLLTAKEHFIAHLLLWKHYRDRPSALAFHKMACSNNANQQRNFTSAQFEKARIAFSESQTGEKNWTRINGGPNKGKPSPNKGKKLASRPHLSGDNNPARRPEIAEKISKALLGHKKSAEHLKKLSDIYYLKPKTICQYCNNAFDYRNYARWHGDNCKLRNT